jgi:hypothetical protein
LAQRKWLMGACAGLAQAGEGSAWRPHVFSGFPNAADGRSRQILLRR